MPEPQRLIVHLGLPKTGTTSLQAGFFPQVEGFLGKKSTELEGLPFDFPNEFDGLAREFVDAYLTFRWKTLLPELVRRLPLDRFPTILWSEENLSVWRDPDKTDSSWVPAQKPLRGERARKGSHPVISFLQEMRLNLPDSVELFTIVTLRAQQTYLPSQAAQVGERNMARVIRGILRRGDEFLFWDQLVRDLEELSGPEHHLTLLFEDGIESNAREIVRFCRLTPRGGEFDYERLPIVNARRDADGGSWVPGTKRLRHRTGTKLSRVSKAVFRRELPLLSRIYTRLRRWLLSLKGFNSVRLSKRQRSRLQYFVASSNLALSKRLNRDLDLFGY